MGVRNLFADILRILTPDELRSLTTVSESEQLFSLTEMMENEFVTPRLREKKSIKTTSSDAKAKILPFTSSVEISKSEENKNSAEALAIVVAEEIKSGEIKATEMNVRVGPQDEVFKEPSIENSESENNVIDIGDFIIREKSKLKDSQKKLKEQEVFGLYRKSAAVDLEQEKLLKNDMSKSANGGILVNKKQL